MDIKLTIPTLIVGTPKKSRTPKLILVDDVYEINNIEEIKTDKNMIEDHPYFMNKRKQIHHLGDIKPEDIIFYNVLQKDDNGFDSRAIRNIRIRTQEYKIIKPKGTSICGDLENKHSFSQKDFNEIGVENINFDEKKEIKQFLKKIKNDLFIHNGNLCIKKPFYIDEYRGEKTIESYVPHYSQNINLTDTNFEIENFKITFMKNIIGHFIQLLFYGSKSELKSSIYYPEKEMKDLAGNLKLEKAKIEILMLLEKYFSKDPRIEVLSPDFCDVANIKSFVDLNFASEMFDIMSNFEYRKQNMEYFEKILNDNKNVPKPY